jgi:urease accessory protein
MLVVTEILGDADDPRFQGRTVERIPIRAADASKRRLRTRTDAGTEIEIDLPRGSFLRDRAVVAVDERRVVIIEREAEPAIIVRLGSMVPETLLRDAALVGHAFGNQHVPIEVADGEIRIPITTSAEIVEETLESLRLTDVETRRGSVPFARDRPPRQRAHRHE